MLHKIANLDKKDLRLLVGLASIALAINLAFVLMGFSPEETALSDEEAALLFTFDNESISDEVVFDSSPNGLDGRIVGAQVTERGESDAMAFTSDNEMIIVDDSDQLSINESSGFTVMLWIRFDNTTFVGDGSSRDYINFIAKGSEGEYEWGLRQYNRSNEGNRGNRISFYAFNRDGGLGAGSYVQDRIKEGEWMHLAGVIRDGKIELWKNGALRDSDRLSDYNIVPENGDAPLLIGSTRGFTFHGAIDDLRIYDRALAGRDIKRIYREGNSD